MITLRKKMSKNILEIDVTNLLIKSINWLIELYIILFEVLQFVVKCSSIWSYSSQISKFYFIQSYTIHVNLAKNEDGKNVFKQFNELFKWLASSSQLAYKILIYN